MNGKIDAFLTDVRNMLGFVAAVTKDPERIQEIEAIERALIAVDQLADENPIVLDIFDKIQATIGRADLSMKAKLLEVGRLLTQARAVGKVIH